MTLHALPLPPPSEASEFEHLCLALFRRHWDDEYAQLYGVQGQAQNGIDIVGRSRRGTERIAVQCKVRSGSRGRLTLADISADMAKAENIQPPLQRLIIATTATRDATLQGRMLELSEERIAAGKFPVTVMAWQDLCELLAVHHDIALRYFPQFFVEPGTPKVSGEVIAVNASHSARSRRLRSFLSLVNVGRDSDTLEVSEIAEQLSMEKILVLEGYFSGADEPPIELLKRIATQFSLNVNWLLHGKGEPFYLAEPFFLEAIQALPHIQSSNPEHVYFIRKNSEYGECLIVLKYSDWNYHCLNTFCHVSAHVGGTGRAQLLSLFDLITELSGPGRYFHCIGQTLEPEEFEALIKGDHFPGTLVDKPSFGSQWWHALMDIAYKNSPQSHYEMEYGKPFTDAQRIIREQIALRGAR